MCGFVGFTVKDSPQKNQKNLEKMMNAIIHRGPDSAGIHLDGEIGLGFRRLAIVDTTPSGSQPMYNEDKTKVLVFNGEIYNYIDIREELINKGYVFKSETDSEVLIHGYQEYGLDLLKKLRGMFSFAIWDQIEKKLIIARDIFGIKPLYYTQHTQNGQLVFGSEIKGILAHEEVIKEFNPKALKPYLTFEYSVLKESFFKGIYSLSPGHYLTYQQGQLSQHAYFDYKIESISNTFDYYQKKIEDTFLDSVRLHRESEVHLGAFLSGGIDSSYLAAVAKPEKVFSVGFEEYSGDFNETDLAKQLASELNIPFERTMLTPDQCLNKIKDIQYHMDEPHANPSAIPLYFLAELASHDVKVVLSGEGADEIFGGYHWYRKSNNQLKYEKIPYFLRRGLHKIAKNMKSNRVTDLVVKGGRTIEEVFIGHARIFEESEANQLLQGPYKKGPSIDEIVGPYYEKVKEFDELSKMQYLDFHFWLPGDILQKADKMTMAHSIEARVPFLDKQVYQLGMKVPSDYKLSHDTTKYILRQVALKALPADYANRKKLGFPVPIRDWIKKEPWKSEIQKTFISRSADQFFQSSLLVDMLEDHIQEKQNNARKIWTIYCFLVWYSVYFEHDET